MDAKKYLDRINFSDTPSADLQSLKKLQLLHLLNVPFENLSIHYNEPIILQLELLFNKIVNRKRGGFCYELNGLFAALLRQLGFNVSMLSAGVANSNGVFGPDFDHMALMALLDERYLVDVGFGDSFLQPLLLDERGIQIQGERSYQIEEKGSYFILKERKPGSDWKPQYRFGLQPYRINDFDKMCRYHQTSPESHFTQKRICSIAKPGGRISLSDMRLIETTGVEKKERILKDEDEYKSVLQKEFGVIL